MRSGVFATVFFVCALIVTSGEAHAPLISEQPVCTMEFIKVKPGMFGSAMGYLDDNWTRVREEARRQGAVLSYRVMAEALMTPHDQVGDQTSIVLLTEYKDQAAYDAREKLFALLRKQLPNNAPAILRFSLSPSQQAELFETVSTRVFLDYSDTDQTHFRLLAKN
jgi:hypothetical protein